MTTWKKDQFLEFTGFRNFFSFRRFRSFDQGCGNFQNISISNSLMTSAMVNTWPDSTLILGRVKDENLEFEKRSDFLNLLDFLFCINNFVQDCRLLILFEKENALNCWMVFKCMLVHWMLSIQSMQSSKSDLYVLILIFSIKIRYFWRLPSILPNKTQKVVFYFFKTHPNIFVVTKIVSARV